MITNVNQVYDFVELVKLRSRERGYLDIAERLDDAMQIGSSALEILGAIKGVLQAESRRISELVDKGMADDVVHFVDRAFGTE